MKRRRRWLLRKTVMILLTTDKLQEALNWAK